MTLRAGEVFAGYTVVGQLGGGGMGEVYLAQHPRLPRQDALKILRADISADEGFRQRFIREANSVAALSHPNIVTVFDRGEFNGKLWIATEYVNGTDAAQLLRDRYPAGMPAVEAASIAAAIGDALDYAHERGLLHRDVKPANILLSEPDRTGRRRVFLADFGIARPMGDPSGLTATNFTVGTVSYAAPEQLMGADIDGRADQYALAATVFHLLAGKPPFEDSNPIAVISKHLTLPPPQLGALRPDLSGLDHILANAMAKDPNQRYPHCAEFTADLTHGATLNPVLPHAPTQAAVPAPVPSTPVPGPPAAATQSAVSFAAERAVPDERPPASQPELRFFAGEQSEETGLPEREGVFWPFTKPHAEEGPIRLDSELLFPDAQHPRAEEVTTQPKVGRARWQGGPVLWGIFLGTIAVFATVAFLGTRNASPEPQAPPPSTSAAATESASTPAAAEQCDQEVAKQRDVSDPRARDIYSCSPMRLEDVSVPYPIFVQNYVTDVPGLLTADQRADVNRAVDQLLGTRNVRLWVVYVDRFDTGAVAWAEQTRTLSGMGDSDAILAVAARQRAYAFLVPSAAANGSSAAVDALRANQIEPALRSDNWVGAAVAAAQGLETMGP